MRKVVSLIAALALLLCALPLAAVADTAGRATNAAVVAVSSVTAAPGGDVEVSVTVTGAYQANILNLFVDYDNNALQLIGSPTSGSVWNAIEAADGTVLTNTETAGRIGFIALLPQGSFSSNGTVFTVGFHVSAGVAEGAALPLTLSVAQFSLDAFDGTSTAVQHTTVNGSVTVWSAPPVVISANTVEAAPGEDIEIEVKLEGEFNANIIHLFVDYDAEVLGLIAGPASGQVWNAITSAEGTIAVNTETEGRIGFIALLPEGSVSTGGVLFTLAFHIADDAQIGTNTSIGIEVAQFSYDYLDGTSNSIPYNTTNGNVTITSSVLVGDVNGDGELSFVDVSALYSILVSGGSVTPEQLAAGDANGDGELSFADVSALYSMLLS